MSCRCACHQVRSTACEMFVLASECLAPPGASAACSSRASARLCNRVGELNLFARERADSRMSVQTAVSTASGSAHQPEVDDDYTHLYCISPDAPTNPVIYWMGCYDAASVKFRLDGASGPFRLDLGDTIYAPNILEDAQGRCVLWAWVQEHRAVGSYHFAGCMATPRILLQRERRLVQQPLPELKAVRKSLSTKYLSLPASRYFTVRQSKIPGSCHLHVGAHTLLRAQSSQSCWSCCNQSSTHSALWKTWTSCRVVQLRHTCAASWEPTALPANARMPLEGLTGQTFDIELVLHRGSSYVTGLMLQSWNAGQGSAAVLYDWENSLLEVCT